MTKKEAIKKVQASSDDVLRNYVREEFVNSGFIEVNQWRNFIDYLQILIRDKQEEAEKQAYAKVFMELDNCIASQKIPHSGKYSGQTQMIQLKDFQWYNNIKKKFMESEK